MIAVIVSHELLTSSISGAAVAGGMELALWCVEAVITLPMAPRFREITCVLFDHPCP
jgi:hypothetical protein